MLRTLIVVPVSTKSTTASAKPKPHAASTDPDTYLIPKMTKDKIKNICIWLNRWVNS